MSENPDIKKALETIVGYELTEDAVQRFDLFSAFAAYDRTDVPGNYVTKKSLIVHLPKTCEPQQGLLDVSGWWVTGSDGTSVFRLTDFICYEALPFMHPVNIVVTPTSSNACFATVKHLLVKNEKNEVVDVEIEMFTWDVIGAPAPNISVNWRCRVPIQLILF